MSLFTTNWVQKSRQQPLLYGWLLDDDAFFANKEIIINDINESNDPVAPENPRLPNQPNGQVNPNLWNQPNGQVNPNLPDTDEQEEKDIEMTTPDTKTEKYLGVNMTPQDKEALDTFEKKVIEHLLSKKYGGLSASRINNVSGRNIESFFNPNGFNLPTNSVAFSKEHIKELNMINELNVKEAFFDQVYSTLSYQLTGVDYRKHPSHPHYGKKSSLSSSFFNTIAF